MSWLGDAIQIRQPRTVPRPTHPQGPRGWLLAVEGPIGVGKTTLAKRLAHYLPCGLILEVVEGNPFLKRFYGDVRRQAFPTQIFFLLSRCRQQQGIVQRLDAGEDIVSDYMFGKDRLFADLTLNEVERSLYDAVHTLVAPRVPRLDAIIYMRAALPALLDRIAARRRSFEHQLTAAYLARVIAAYQAFFEDLDHVPVIVVETERLDPRQDAGLAAVARAVRTVRHGAQTGGGEVR
jgi:deoxyadenosine/deoxycytidine kinase